MQTRYVVVNIMFYNFNVITHIVIIFISLVKLKLFMNSCNVTLYVYIIDECEQLQEKTN